MPVADTMLRLAEFDPPFFRPLWSPDILREVKSTLLKFEYSEQQAARRIRAIEEAFPEALIEGYEGLVSAIDTGVNPKDRHVVAAAIRAGADCIVSDNTKHFPNASLSRYGIECLSAEDFLVHQYHLDPDTFIAILRDQAKCIQRSLADLVALLSKHVPQLADLIKA